MKRKEALWTKNFVLITLINFLLYSSFQMFPSSMPAYVQGLGAAERVLGWITGITTIATLLVRPIAGKVLDQYGRKGIFFLGLAIMIGTTICYFFFPVVAIILLLRFIHGIGWGIATTASNTVASDNIVPSRFGEGMGYFSLSISLALAIAPALSLAMEMQTVFLVSLVFLIISTVLLVLLPVTEQTKTPKEVSKRQALYEKNAAIPTLLIFLITTTYGGIATFIGSYGAEKGLANIGLFFTVYALGMLVTRPILGSLLDRYGYDIIILPSLLLVTVGLLILVGVSGTASLVISAIFYGVGYGSLQTCLQTMAVASSASDRVGAANATYYTGFDGGIGFGSVLSGMLVSGLGYSGMYLVMAAFPLVGAVVYFALQRKKTAESSV